VVADRQVRTKFGDRAVELPCCGIVEMRSGKMRVWRDRFGLATYTGDASGGVPTGW